MNKVVRNTLSLFSGQSLAHGIALLFNIYMGRALAPEAYGNLAFAIAYVIVFMVIAEYGLHTLLIRDIARTPEKAGEYFWNSLILKTVLSLIACVVGFGVLHTFYRGAAHQEQRILVYLVTASLFFNAWYFSLAAVFRAYQEMHVEASLFLLGKSVYVVAGALALFLWGNVYYLAILFSVAAAVQFFVALICLIRRHRHLRFSFSPAMQVYLLRTGWLFFSITLFTTLHMRFDYIIVPLFCGEDALGYYHGAYNLVLAPIILTNAFVQSMYPVLSELHAKGDARFEHRIRMGFRWLAVIAFPVLFFVTGEGYRILTQVYQDKFAAGVLALQILVWGQGLDFFCPFAGHILYVLEKQRRVIIVTAASVVTNIVLNLLFIPLWGITGASITMVISLSVMLIGYLIALRDTVPVSAFVRALAAPLAIALVTAPLIWILRPHVPFILNGLIYCAVYGGLILLTRTIRISDLHLFSAETRSETTLPPLSSFDAETEV